MPIVSGTKTFHSVEKFHLVPLKNFKLFLSLVTVVEDQKLGKDQSLSQYIQEMTTDPQI